MVATLLALIALSTGCAERPLRAGEEARGPWWMRLTAMSKDGQLTLSDKPWWKRAVALQIGEQFVVETDCEPDRPRASEPDRPRASEPDRPRSGLMLVRKERCPTRSGKQVEAIVWIIDDDEDGSIRDGGDRDSDCYIADYGCDGSVDRMVDYIDNDGDADADEMDIRYFVDGQLRYAWFGMDLDDDNAMWSLTGYEYGGPSFFEADPYGNNMIYMNKLNTRNGTWSPISECPFAFYDTDGDGYSEVVVRVSATPLNYDTSVDPDYANDYSRFAAPWSSEMERMGAVNVRYSFDVDNASGPAWPLHYEFGFNLVGAVPYSFPGMRHFNPKRRPPQVTCVIPHGAARAVADTYPASQTGFSWHEQYDDTISIGYGSQVELDYRWEGVFWTWERRFMGNTGGPGQKWNVRREWTSRPTDRRELYYSEVDRRIHLFGAEEGWIQVGHFAGLGPIGEIRMSDTDGNGYFDRWEVYEAGSPLPVRVSTVRDEKARRIPFDYDWLVQFYTQEVLPQAMDANARLTAAMNRVHPLDPPEGLRQAVQSGPVNHRRYAQDLAVELHYQDLRRHFAERADHVLREAKMDDLRPLPELARQTTWNSQTAWRVVRVLEKLDVAVGEADLDAVEKALDELDRIQKVVK